MIDNYLGTGDQWSVYAKLSSFTDGTKQHTMFGTMTISPNTNGQKDESGIDLNSGKTVQLNFGEKESDDIPIYSATADHGMGKVTLPINYQLNVTQAKYKGTYTAKLTYTFTKTPTTAVGS
ncbi:hypothetical protein FD37_GL000851 [Levilactobacillus spicheri DSM 15429]|uniref:WxL domain-containing protein n=1 Tax=Levilactobacillus spicheri DSM 15429 TaxID=1423805 RepID=A0A0R1QXF6_9LACO|nr:hypothetical protein FD37_GL000851 [Levilactobacillus spicheri DSM 15429]